MIFSRTPVAVVIRTAEPRIRQTVFASVVAFATRGPATGPACQTSPVSASNSCSTTGSLSCVRWASLSKASLRTRCKFALAKT